jgi:arsenite-transporting ATPase
MPSIHVYEPALCCNTGVCGPDPAQELITFTADLNHVKSQGGDIARHNLANDTLAFAESEAVRGFLQVAGSEGLPLVLIDGVTVLTGRYPTRDELLRWTGLGSERAVAPSPSRSLPVIESCCGGSAQASSGGCCAPSQPGSTCC